LIELLQFMMLAPSLCTTTKYVLLQDYSREMRTVAMILWQTRCFEFYRIYTAATRNSWP